MCHVMPRGRRVCWLHLVQLKAKKNSSASLVSYMKSSQLSLIFYAIIIWLVRVFLLFFLAWLVGVFFGFFFLHLQTLARLCLYKLQNTEKHKSNETEL